MIIHDAEVNIWGKPQHPQSLWFETFYRQLKVRFNRDQVPIDCYLLFFDVATELAIQNNIPAEEYSQKLSLKSQCPSPDDQEKWSIEAKTHLNILRGIGLGKEVVRGFKSNNLSFTV